ncbi:MAG: hypothetical protein ACFB9N_05070 [Geitlerinemataceae cyanobacterium]
MPTPPFEPVDRDRWIVRKSCRTGFGPDDGIACSLAGIEGGRIYDREADAIADAETLSEWNPVGFVAVLLPAGLDGTTKTWHICMAGDPDGVNYGGELCEVAEVEPFRVYATRGEALVDWAKLCARGRAVFRVVEITR